MTAYLPTRVSFDVETTSYETNGVKKSVVYAWTICVDGVVTIYRERDEFLSALRALAAERGASWSNRLVVYVHNLGYEYEFIRRYFEIVPYTYEDPGHPKTEAFFIGNGHRPARLLTQEGIEFRCSYLLTNSSLARVGETVGVEKMEGDLDYRVLRHSGTPLTEAEEGYIRNDVLIIDALIKERLELDSYSSIPMTLTGYTRRRVRARVNKDARFKRWLRNTRLDRDTYDAARTCFRGGYTHASAASSGTIQENVVGWDIASSYPASIAQFTFPMSAFGEVEPEYLPDRRAFIYVEFTGIECAYDFAIISESACESVTGALIDNGRVFRADTLKVWMTDVDFQLAARNYRYKSVTILKCLAAKAGYLPTAFVGAILDMYEKKTSLKGVAGSEVEYAEAKVDVNSVYGMTAEDPVKDQFAYFPEHHSAGEVVIPIDEQIEAHNNSNSRFLYYPWAAFVTAWARYVLQSAIMDLADAGVNVHYCDTDSIYATGDHEIIEREFERINSEVSERMTAAMIHHDFPIDKFAPATIKGEMKPLGYFEPDAQVIDRFKSLGAKRYLKEIDGKLSLTVSGLSKNAAGWISDNGGFDAFVDGMTVPASESGRLIHSYLDDEIDEDFTDYLGETRRVTQHGGVHLAESSYVLGVSDEYSEFLTGYQD